MVGVGELLGGSGEETAFYNRGGGIYTSLETWGWVMVMRRERRTGKTEKLWYVVLYSLLNF